MNTVNHYQYRWILLVVVVLITSLACRLGLPGPEKPGDPIMVSTEAAGAFENEIQRALEQAQQDGVVEITFNESELTSYIAVRLQEQPDLQFLDPQVYLREGKVQVFTSYNSGSISVPIKAVFLPRINSVGEASFELESIDMGSIAVPDSLEKRIQEEVNRSFTLAIQNTKENIFVDSLVVQDGVINLKGSLR